jgi:hypothetical protein
MFISKGCWKCDRVIRFESWQRLAGPRDSSTWLDWIRFSFSLCLWNGRHDQDTSQWLWTRSKTSWGRACGGASEGVSQRWSKGSQCYIIWFTRDYEDKEDKNVELLESKAHTDTVFQEQKNELDEQLRTVKLILRGYIQYYMQETLI